MAKRNRTNDDLNKALHRKLKIEQREPHQKPRVNSYTLEG
jgi:hypothetical protein